MATVFCKQRLDFVRKTTIKQLKKKKTIQKPEHGKKYVFLAKCIENAVLRKILSTKARKMSQRN